MAASRHRWWETVIKSRIRRGSDWGLALQRALLEPPVKPAQWMAEHTRIIKRDEYSRVGLLTLRQQLCYLKFYRAKSIAQQGLFGLGRGRAMTAFDRALELTASNVPVPEPRACVLVPGGVLLLTEGMSDAADLKALWLRPRDVSASVKLMTGAGELLGGLHSAGFAHGDCKWSNLLWSDDSFTLIDLEAVARVAPGSSRQARDIARFTVNAEDLGVSSDHYDQFLTTYLQSVGITREALLLRVLPILEQLRVRHLQKYGERGARLL